MYVCVDTLPSLWSIDTISQFFIIPHEKISNGFHSTVTFLMHRNFTFFSVWTTKSVWFIKKVVNCKKTTNVVTSVGTGKTYKFCIPSGPRVLLSLHQMFLNTGWHNQNNWSTDLPRRRVPKRLKFPANITSYHLQCSSLKSSAEHTVLPYRLTQTNYS